MALFTLLANLHKRLVEGFQVFSFTCVSYQVWTHKLSVRSYLDLYNLRVPTLLRGNEIISPMEELTPVGK